MSVAEQVGVKVTDMGDWQLIVALTSPCYQVNKLNRQQRSEVYKAIWAYSDGYGEPGYIPAQGYDWSGIRDSTSEATQLMACQARLWLADHHIKQLDFVKVI